MKDLYQIGDKVKSFVTMAGLAALTTFGNVGCDKNETVDLKEGVFKGDIKVEMYQQIRRGDFDSCIIELRNTAGDSVLKIESDHCFREGDYIMLDGEKRHFLTPYFELLKQDYVYKNK